MRRFAMLLALLLTLCACSGNTVKFADLPGELPEAGPEENAAPEKQTINMNLGPSVQFSREELQAAAACVMEQFGTGDYADCTLTEISYDEADSDWSLGQFQKNGHWEELGLSQGNALLLTCAFKVGENCTGSFEPGTSWQGWQCVLARQDSDSPWEWVE